MEIVYQYEFNSGRNALRALVREFGIKQIHIPFYLCPVIRNVLKKEGCEVLFYHIDESFFPQKEFGENDFVLYPNYFGICTKNVKRLCAKYKNLIVDNAHSFYSPHFGFASFNSYRKFFFHNFGVKDGSCLSVAEAFKTVFKKDETEYEVVKNNFEYSELLKNEKRVDDFEILTISDCSQKAFSSVDFEKDKAERRKKFFELHQKYNGVNEIKMELEENDVPFVYPLLTRDKKLSEEITKNNDLIMRYWTNLPEKFTEYKFYRYLIPIPLTK